MRELLEDTAQRAISSIEGLPDRGVAPAAEAVAKLAILNQPLNDEPTSPEQVINLLDANRFNGFEREGNLTKQQTVETVPNPHQRPLCSPG